MQTTIENARNSLFMDFTLIQSKLDYRPG
jgi:hypothetical protein